MKKFIITLFICFLLTPIAIFAQNNKYYSSQYHYSFEIPEEWSQIPKSQVDIFSKNLKDNKYKTGFKLNKTNVSSDERRSSRLNNFFKPYFLVQEIKIKTPSYDKLESLFGSELYSDRINELEKDLPQKISGATMQAPVLDKEKNVIFTKLKMSNNSKEIKGLSAAFLGEESIIQLNFYAPASTYQDYLPFFEEIIDSFKYYQGYKYKNNNDSGLFDGLVPTAAVNLVVGAIIASLLVFFGRKKNEEQDINDQKETKNEHNQKEEDSLSTEKRFLGFALLLLIVLIIILLT